MSRGDVEARNTGEWVASFERILKVPEFVRALQGGTVVTFDGYDADRREITQIPEVLDYLRQLHSELPFLLYFLDPDPRHGALMHFVAAHGGRVIEDAGPGRGVSVESTDEAISALSACVLDAYAFGERYADAPSDVIRRLLEPYGPVAHAVHAKLGALSAG